MLGHWIKALLNSYPAHHRLLWYAEVIPCPGKRPLMILKPSFPIVGKSCSQSALGCACQDSRPSLLIQPEMPAVRYAKWNATSWYNGAALIWMKRSLFFKGPLVATVGSAFYFSPTHWNLLPANLLSFAGSESLPDKCSLSESYESSPCPFLEATLLQHLPSAMPVGPGEAVGYKRTLAWHLLNIHDDMNIH